MSWARLEREAPEIAAKGRALIYQGETGQGLLATVPTDGPPRIHPVWVAVKDGRLLLFVNPSAKRADLRSDARYALHTYIDPQAPSEFSLRGRCVAISGDERARIAADWYFTTTDGYDLYELQIETALLGERRDADAWPPLYSRWSATGGR